MNTLKTYLFSYHYQGSDYSIEIPAYSLQEAQSRVQCICGAKYDGELKFKLPGNKTAGRFISLFTSIMNKLNFRI